MSLFQLSATLPRTQVGNNDASRIADVHDFAGIAGEYVSFVIAEDFEVVENDNVSGIVQDDSDSVAITEL